MKFLAIAVGCLISATTAFAEDRCNGVTPKHHSRGVYDFSTNSRVESEGKYSKYFACVENNDKDDWLRLSWFIPLMTDRWVPPGGMLEEFRLSADASARPVDGCLRYGNLEDKVLTQLLGDGKDERRSGGTSEVECRNSLGLDASGADVVELPPAELLHEGRVFVPSDLNDPVGSMLEVNVTIGVKPTGGSGGDVAGNGYTSFFTYNAEPYKGSANANPDAVRLRPKFTPDAKALYTAFVDQVKTDDIQLAKKGSFDFLIQGGKQWTIQPVVYEFVDKDDNVLSSLSVSLFVPAESR